jgi:hypothetical protein
MSKTLAFKVPAKPSEKGADDWINRGVEEHLEPRMTPDTAPAERMKRLTVEVPVSLHTRVKVGCAKEGVKIADEVRDLLAKRFPEWA